MADRIGSGDAERELENGAVPSPVIKIFKQGKLNCTE